MDFFLSLSPLPVSSAGDHFTRDRSSSRPGNLQKSLSRQLKLLRSVVSAGALSRGWVVAVATSQAGGDGVPGELTLLTGSAVKWTPLCPFTPNAHLERRALRNAF